MPRPDRVTIAEVAAAAGVSVPTVSKVLNGRADVAAATRERVRHAVRASGYRRRAPAHRPAGLVDVVVEALDSLFVLEVLRGAEAEARRAGGQIVVTATDGAPVEGRPWLDRLAARRTDGLVLVVSDSAPDTAAALAALHAPIVLLDPVGGADPALATVGATNWAGAVSAVEHLCTLGHRRIGVVSGPPRLQCSVQRVEGYRAALRRAGIAADERLVTSGDFHPAGGRASAATLLDLPEPPTALFAGADMHAVGIYQEAGRRGLRIPGDLSVVGFDDLPVCEMLRPALTTVRQPLARMAAEAVRLVLAAPGDAAAGPAPRVELATSLVVRGSTGPPPAP